jgi:hypothetical protein
MEEDKMSVTLEELCGLISAWVAQKIATPLGGVFGSRLVDSPILSAPWDRWGRRLWAVAFGMKSIVFPNKEMMMTFAHRLAARACEPMLAERAQEEIARVVTQFLRETGLHHRPQDGLTRRLALGQTPSQRQSLQTLVESQFARYQSLGHEFMAQCEADAKAKVEQFVSVNQNVVLAAARQALAAFIHRTVNHPRWGVVAAAQCLDLLRTAWQQSVAQFEQMRERQISRLHMVDANVQRAEKEMMRSARSETSSGKRASDMPPYVYLLGQWRQRTLERALVHAEIQLTNAALAMVTGLLGDLEEWQARVDLLKQKMTTLRDHLSSEEGRLANLNLSWRAPNGLVLDTADPAHYDAMLRGVGAIERKEAAAVERLWSDVVTDNGNLLDHLDDFAELGKELLCRAALNFQPRDVMDVLIEQRGEKGALDLLRDTLRDSRELLPLKGGDLDPNATQRIAFIAVKDGASSPLAQLLRRVVAEAEQIFYVDHECADSILIEMYRFGFPVSALAMLDAYSEDDAQVQREHESELCHTDPNYRDLPDLKPIKFVNDPKLDEYLAIGKAVGAVQVNADGEYVFVPLRGAPVLMGAASMPTDEAAAKEWLLRHQDRLVHIASRWIAQRVLEGAGTLEKRLAALNEGNQSDGRVGAETLERLRLILKERGAFSLVPADPLADLSASPICRDNNGGDYVRDGSR